ncbi:major facilitator superfamily domain-containing protein [Dissophora ornata]|nr:major facilitator superfamily domain-containing protein [Dissophora ornata]
MMGYPLEGDKGKYFGIFWAIFNAGGVVGNMIPMAMSWNDGNKAKQVSTATYIVFMCITAFGAVLSLLLLPASKITRNDGSPVTKVKFSSPIIEVRGILSLFKDWRMLALFPMFFTSNWFYTYQFNLNAVNSASIRSRSFDSAFYWGAQVVASLAFGVLLDRPQWTRSTRGRYGFVILVAILIATWGGAIGFQSGVGPRNIIDTDGVYSTAPGDFESLDLIDTTGEWIKFFLLYIMFGACDAMFQAYAYWLMGSLSNDIHVVARYSGFYKFAQNIGGIFAGQVANSRISNTAEHLNIATTHGMGELGVCIALLAFSVICATPVVLKAIQDTTVEDVFEEEQKQKQEYADDANV